VLLVLPERRLDEPVVPVVPVVLAALVRHLFQPGPWPVLLSWHALS